MIGPVPVYPRNAERLYRRRLGARVAAIVRRFRSEVLAKIATRADATDAVFDLSQISPETALGILDQIRAAVNASGDPDELIETVFARVDRIESRNIANLGIGIIPIPSTIPPTWRSDQIDLIRDIDRETLDRLGRAIVEANADGWSLRRLSREVSRIAGVSRRRADLIATNETGNLSSTIQREKQQAAGITEYIWTTSADERVRDSHRALNGKRMSWDQPDPTEGHPGQAIRCRCTPRPVIPDQ